MAEWWNLLSVYQRVIFIISSTTTLIFLIQLVFLLIGFGDGSDFDDIDDINDGDFGELFGLKLITIRGIFAFFCIGGWTTFILLDASSNIALSTCIGIVGGLATMFLLAFFMKQTLKLEESGNININNTIGLTGTVYFTIPKQKQGVGKISILVQGRLAEYDAVTNDLEDLKQGQSVKVIAQNNNILEVSKI